MQKLSKRTDEISGKFDRFMGWFILSILALGVLIFLASFISDQFFGTGEVVQDTLYRSPGGAYVAAIRDVDTGAAGSFSVILLKSGKGQFPRQELEDSIIADDSYKEFGPLTWLGPRTLQVTYGSNKPPPGWKTKWRDVRIVYQ